MLNIFSIPTEKERELALNVVQKAYFLIRDYDSTLFIAETHIEEREWRFGQGWFKWLSLFRKPKIRRDLHIEYSICVGKDKNSWKGGVCGTSIDLEPNELHESAIQRHCDLNHRAKYDTYRLEFIRRLDSNSPEILEWKAKEAKQLEDAKAEQNTAIETYSLSEKKKV